MSFSDKYYFVSDRYDGDYEKTEYNPVTKVIKFTRNVEIDDKNEHKELVKEIKENISV